MIQWAFESKYSNCSSASHGLLVVLTMRKREDRWQQRC